MTKKFNVDFKKALPKVFIVYGAIFLVGIIIACIFGVKLDINFKGGTVISYSYTGEINADEAKTAIDGVLTASYKLTQSSAIADESNTLTVSLVENSSVDAGTQEKLTETLEEKYAENGLKLYSSTSVNPTVAGAFFLKSLVAIIITSLLVVLYVGIRFRKIGGVTAALTSLLALVIDLFVTFFVCVIFRLEIDSNYIAVVLTILGYSLNDTIVVYDRIRENKKLMTDTPLGEVVNVSLNSVITRNVVTSVTTILAVITIIVVAELFGLSSLRTFAIPMAFGLISGCITSLFVASPLWVLWRNKLDAKKK